MCLLLANLTQLKWGDLRNNDISDFSPLDTVTSKHIYNAYSETPASPVEDLK